MRNTKTVKTTQRKNPGPKPKYAAEAERKEAHRLASRKYQEKKRNSPKYKKQMQDYHKEYYKKTRKK